MKKITMNGTLEEAIFKAVMDNLRIRRVMKKTNPNKHSLEIIEQKRKEKEEKELKRLKAKKEKEEKREMKRREKEEEKMIRKLKREQAREQKRQQKRKKIWLQSIPGVKGKLIINEEEEVK